MNNVKLPVTGMLSQADADRLEIELYKISGILQVQIDWAEERARVLYDPAQVDLFDIEIAINQVGLCLPNAEISIPFEELGIRGLPADFEERLERIPGILLATDSVSKSLVRVQYIPEVISVDQVRQAIIEVDKI